MKKSNPLSKELVALRSSMLPDLLRTASANTAHGNTTLRLFELGRVFRHDETGREEMLEAVIVLSGLRHPERYSAEKTEMYDFFDLRGLLENWFSARNIRDISFTNGDHPAFHRGVCAKVCLGDTCLGQLGEIDTGLFDNLQLKYPLFLALIDVDTILSLDVAAPEHKSLPQFPSVTRDVVFAANEDLLHQQVLDTIESVGIETLENVELGEIFTDQNVIGEGKKSMAYTLTFRSPLRTLTDAEINEAQETIRLALLKKLPIEIR